MAATRLTQVRLGDGVVWVEAVVPPGSEPTAAPGRAAEKVLEAFDAAETVMTELAVKVARSVQEMGTRSVHPDEVGVEFGLKIATTGSVIVASGSAEASLVVKILYKRAQPGAAGADGTP